jgi:hypothetical protein
MTSKRSLTLKPSIFTASILFIAVLTVLTELAATAIAQNPVPFVDLPLIPDAIGPGTAEFTLTVNGAGFVAASVVNWNGSQRATTFVSSSQLTAKILASDIAKASTATVTVVNPTPGGGVSNIQFFSIAVAEASGSFLPAATYVSAASSTYSVAAADLRGNGKLDLVVVGDNGGGNGSVGVLLGNGDGTFQPVVTYGSGGEQPYWLAVADLNGDGKLDLVVANSYYSDTVGVLLGNGDGTFKPVVTYSTGGGPSSVAVADVNGDGKPDILVSTSGCYGCSAGLVGVLLGNGDGTFQPVVAYSSGGYDARSIAVEDLNGDGKLDIAVANLCGAAEDCSGNSSLGVLLGNGDGTFKPAVTFSSGGPGTDSVAAADVNGDGKPDLVVANLCPSGSSNCSHTEEDMAGVLLGNGDGTFQPVVLYASGGYGAESVAVADVNGDGKPDLVVANLCSSIGSDCPYPGTGDVGVLLGNGDGSFQPALTFGAGGPAASAAIADVNGDGRPDLLVANINYLVAVLLNNSASPRCVGKCATSTALVSGLNPSVQGQAVTFTATVTSTSGTPPDGETVTFYNRSGVLGTALLTGGIASLTKSSLGSGIHTISAAYGGDANFSASISPVLQQVVDTSSQSPTTTSLASSLNPSIYGQKVTWTATVTPTGKTTPTGKVNFNWGSQSIGNAILNSSGVATLTRSNLSADTYPLFAVYVGDANDGPSTSAVLNQVVTETTTSAALTSSPNPSTQGQAVTFTATITSRTVTAAGPVTFTAGKIVLGTAQLSGGKAKFTTSTLDVGSTRVTVTYDGDSNIAKSSASVTQIVQQ